MPRERPAPVVMDEGPLILVETKRDLRNMTLPFEQETRCDDHRAPWTFETRHKHRSGRTIRVVHFGVNLG